MDKRIIFICSLLTIYDLKSFILKLSIFKKMYQYLQTILNTRIKIKIIENGVSASCSKLRLI